jgi:DNA modification methylase
MNNIVGRRLKSCIESQTYKDCFSDLTLLASLLNSPTPPSMGYRSNVWDVPVGFNKSTRDRIAFQHPAIQSEFISDALIRAYSKPGDIVFDPFAGSGTTLKMADVNGREAIGLERSKKYVQLAVKRLKPYCQNIEIRLER